MSQKEALVFNTGSLDPTIFNMGFPMELFPLILIYLSQYEKLKQIIFLLIGSW